MEMPSPVFIVDAARTPFGALGGALRHIPPAALAGGLLRGLASRQQAPLEPLEAIALGQVVGAGVGPDLAQQAARAAALSPARAWTVSAGLRSGLEALLQACALLQAQGNGLALAGGLESASQAPYLLPSARWGVRIGEVPLLDALIQDGPPSDPGATAELRPAPEEGLDRLPVVVQGPRGVRRVEADEAAHPIDPWSAPPGDGAAVALLATGPAAAARPSRARIVGWGTGPDGTPCSEVVQRLVGDLGLRLPNTLVAAPAESLLAPAAPRPWGALGPAALLALLQRLEAGGGRHGLLVMGAPGAPTLALAIERTTP